jgi:hypothetical protein
LEFGSSTSFVKTFECCLFFLWFSITYMFNNIMESTYIHGYIHIYIERETHTHIHILNLPTKLDTLFSNIYWPFAYPSQGYWCLDSL